LELACGQPDNGSPPDRFLAYLACLSMIRIALIVEGLRVWLCKMAKASKEQWKWSWRMMGKNSSG